eukprot:1766923-Amphidinium_carterae.1
MAWGGQLDEADERKRRAHDQMKAAREKFLLGEVQGTLLHSLHVWRQMTVAARSMNTFKESWKVRIAANFLDEDKGNLKKTFRSWYDNVKLFAKLKMYISTWFKGDLIGVMMTVFREWSLLAGRSIMVRHHQSQIQELDSANNRSEAQQPPTVFRNGSWSSRSPGCTSFLGSF